MLVDFRRPPEACRAAFARGYAPSGLLPPREPKPRVESTAEEPRICRSDTGKPKRPRWTRAIASTFFLRPDLAIRGARARRLPALLPAHRAFHRHLFAFAHAHLGHELLLLLLHFFCERFEVDLGLLHRRKQLFLLFLDVVIHVLAKHRDEGAILLVWRPRLLDLLDQVLGDLVLHARLIDEGGFFFVQRLACRRVEHLLLDLRVAGQLVYDLRYI